MLSTVAADIRFKLREADCWDHASSPKVLQEENNFG
jgi:hypothetical protein